MENGIIDRLETATKLSAAAKEGLTRIPTMDAQGLLMMLKWQEAEMIECEMCGHRLQKDWNWCPWCRWETARR